LRVPKGWVSIIAKKIIESLTEKNLIKLKFQEDETINLLEQLIIDELTIEDRLDAEVRELLKKYDREIEKGRLDYRRLFEITKQKLVRERNIVL